jgi:hypothetical protein
VGRFASVLVVVTALAMSACASLGGVQAVVQPPQFRVAAEQQAEIRLLGPATNRPAGGASVRLWAHVQNPNAFGITLSALDGTLFLEGLQAALVDFPLGLPLAAAQDTVIPLDVIVGFADVPRVASSLLGAVGRNQAQYRLEGRARVNAGFLGQPVFGPLTIVEGTVPVLR